MDCNTYLCMPGLKHFELKSEQSLCLVVPVLVMTTVNTHCVLHVLLCA
jgi:hypothetical protein